MNILIMLIVVLMGCSNKILKLKNKPLLEAAKSGNLEELVESLTHEDVNMVDENRMTALILAAENGHSRAIRALIQAGADVNHANKSGRTALMIAGHNGHVEAIRELIAGGADVNHVNKYGDTALIFAAGNGNVEAITALIVAGANVNHANSKGWTALMYDAFGGSVEAIRALIQAGADVNHHANHNGYTALMCAADKGNAEAIKALIEGGAEVNHVNKYGDTALIEAGNGHVEAIKALIEGGANVNYCRPDGCTALMWAALLGHLISFMKVYAKVKFNLQDDVSENVLVNSAFILLLRLLNTDTCINRFTNVSEITEENINEFLSDPLIDLSGTFVLTSNGTTMEVNIVETIYKSLLVGVFDAIYKSDKKDEMMTVVKEKMSYVKKLEMLKYIIFRNKNKLLKILTNTIEEDPETNEKREVLQNMVKPLLEVNGHHAKAVGITVDMIYIIFKDKLTSDFMIELRDNGWNFEDLSSLNPAQ